MYEIADVLRTFGRAWWFVVVVAVAAGAAAYATAPSVEGFRTRAVVGADPSNDAANSRIDFVRNLAVAATTTSVLEDVAAEVDRGVDELRDGLEVARLEDSQLTEVIWTDPVDAPEVATGVVTAFPVAAQRLLGADTGEASGEVLVARRDELAGALATADEQLAAAVDGNDGVDPVAEMALLQDRAAVLRLEQEVAVAQGRDEDAADAAEAAEVVLEQLADVRAPAAAAASLVEGRARLLAELTDVERRAFDAQLAAATPPPAVEVQYVARQVVDTPALVQRVVAAAVLAAGVTVLALVILTASRRGRGGHSGAAPAT